MLEGGATHRVDCRQQRSGQSRPELPALAGPSRRDAHVIRSLIRTTLILIAVAAAAGTAHAQTYTLTDLGRGVDAEAVNATGQVVGSYPTDTGFWHAYLWTPTRPNGSAGKTTDLGTLPGYPNSRAHGV